MTTGEKPGPFDGVDRDEIVVDVANDGEFEFGYRVAFKVKKLHKIRAQSCAPVVVRPRWWKSLNLSSSAAEKHFE